MLKGAMDYHGPHSRDVIMNPQMFQSSHHLTVAIYTALASRDVSCAWRFVQSYREPNSNNTQDHIRAANQFWREQLASVTMINTMDARRNLIDAIDMHDWLRLFAQYVAPVVVSMDLPQELPQSTGFGPIFGCAPA